VTKIIDSDRGSNAGKKFAIARRQSPGRRADRFWRRPMRLRSGQALLRRKVNS
jgi:hypothetical protein